MLIDARTLPTGETIETEVCIVGAGPAGITLAREFASARFRVCLLESRKPFSNPTLTIVALAIRLADHVKTIMA